MTSMASMAEPMDTNEDDDGRAEAKTARRRSSIGKAKSEEDLRIEEFFGMDPSRFIDDCCNTIDDYISDGLDVMEGSVLKKSKGDVPKDMVVACINRLQAKYRETADANFGKFEEYLRRNILNVPEWIAEEEANKNKPSDARSAVKDPEETTLDADLAEMERQLEEVAAKQRGVKHEINESKARIRRGTQKLENVASLLSDMAIDDVNSLFTQAKALEPAVREGRHLLSSMGPPASSESTKSSRLGEGLRMGGKCDLENLQQLNSRIFANLSNRQTPDEEHSQARKSLPK